jgi:acetoin utilization deacetylase AcuC-like enzyme
MFFIANHPIYNHPLPEGHRFPMLKYELLPKQLLHEGTAEPTDFYSPEPIDLSLVHAVHTPSYVKALTELTLDAKAIRSIGFPLSAALVERELRIAQGTVAGCNHALEHGIAFNIAGGTHHAFSDRGEAFCLLNDQAIAAQYLINQKKCQKILIIDLDVHQGNGTAEIFQNNTEVITFSMHGKSNYPFRKEISDYDIPLLDKTDDITYLAILQEKLPELLSLHRPDFVFYLAGVDILGTDKLGKLGCTLEGCKARDSYVLGLCKSLGIPVQVSMGGGYSPAIKTIIEAHTNTYRVARGLY